MPLDDEGRGEWVILAAVRGYEVGWKEDDSMVGVSLDKRFGGWWLGWFRKFCLPRKPWNAVLRRVFLTSFNGDELTRLNRFRLTEVYRTRLAGKAPRHGSRWSMRCSLGVVVVVVVLGLAGLGCCIVVVLI